jgi:hypothetical protein
MRWQAADSLPAAQVDAKLMALNRIKLLENNLLRLGMALKCMIYV